MTVPLWSSIVAEVGDSLTGYVAAALLALLVLSRRRPPDQRGSLRSALVLLVLHLLVLPVAGVLRYAASPAYGEVRLLSLALLALCAVRIAVDLLFALLLPRAGMRASRILQDVVTAAASLVALFSLASRAGLNVAGLVATSAVMTAVIGFALRDTLGNVIGGLALQTDRSIRIGDWIKVGEVEGRVAEIRWRYAAVETRNGETLIVPNSLLTGEKVMVLGRRQGQPLQWRRWVHFNVDFRHPPTEVSRVVLDALKQEDSLPGVSPEPPPDCVAVDFQAGYTRYAVRYWLTDLVPDVAVDSQVRTRIYFALQRAGLSLSLPAHSVFLTEESRERRQELEAAEQARRLQALQRVELFRPLSEEDRQFLAGSLHYAPFAAGEALTRQGAEAHWLYLIVEGRVAVRVAEGGLDREVAQLGHGDFFGEMSLMTGEPRSATVVALGAVQTYRLDKAAFQEILRRGPALADPVAEILARRRVGLTAVLEDLDQEARKRRVVAVQVDLLARIRDFFGLSDDAQRRVVR